MSNNAVRPGRACSCACLSAGPPPPRVPILRVVCVPMNVFKAVIMLMQVCMFESQVLPLVSADFLPSAKGDPNAECAQRDCRRERNVVPVLHRK